jgi:hypothetical protein
MSGIKGRSARSLAHRTSLATLAAHGFAVTSSAYPFGSFDSGTELVAHDCGYNSGTVLDHICDHCDAHSVTAADFQALLDWLRPRAASGTVVETAAQVIGGPVPGAAVASGSWWPQ